MLLDDQHDLFYLKMWVPRCAKSTTKLITLSHVQQLGTDQSNYHHDKSNYIDLYIYMHIYFYIFLVLLVISTHPLGLSINLWDRASVGFRRRRWVGFEDTDHQMSWRPVVAWTPGRGRQHDQWDSLQWDHIAENVGIEQLKWTVRKRCVSGTKPVFTTAYSSC